jgi:hypothetical protein
MIVMTICSLLLRLQMKRRAHTDTNVPAAPPHVTKLDRARPEIRIERLLNLEEATGFDPDLTSLLRRERNRQRGIATRNTVSYYQLASVSHAQKGVP